MTRPDMFSKIANCCISNHCNSFVNRTLCYAISLPANQRQHSSVGSMLILGSVCYCLLRHLTLILQNVADVMRETSTEICFTTAHTEEKKYK